MSQHPSKRVMVVMMIIIPILDLNSMEVPSYFAFAQDSTYSNNLVITDGIATGDLTDNSAEQQEIH